MNLIMDAWVQFVQMALLFVVVTQNFAIRARLRALEEKLNGEKPR